MTGLARVELALVVAYAAACTLLAGPSGLLAGLLTALVAWQTAPVYAVAVGGPAIAITLPATPLALAPAIILALLLATTLRDAASPARTLTAVTVAALAVGGVTTAALQAGDAVWLAAASLLATVGVAGYLLHRIELVSLDLVHQ